MSPGLPASARRFSVLSLNEVLVIRDMRPDSRLASGRSVRSTNGCWSSSSSRFLACIDPSWVSRAWTGSTGELPASATTISRMPMAAAAAMTIAITGIDQTSMSTMRRMNMKPMNIMNPPKMRMTTPAGSPRTSGGLANIGSMNPGAAMNRKPARPIGRNPTT